MTSLKARYLRPGDRVTWDGYMSGRVVAVGPAAVTVLWDVLQPGAKAQRHSTHRFAAFDEVEPLATADD